MKKLFLLALCAFFAFSCNNEDFITNPEDSTTTLKTVNQAEYVLDQFVGLPVRIYLPNSGGLGKYMGLPTPATHIVSLVKDNIGDTNQQWVLKKRRDRFEFETYHISLITSPVLPPSYSIDFGGKTRLITVNGSLSDFYFIEESDNHIYNTTFYIKKDSLISNGYRMYTYYRFPDQGQDYEYWNIYTRLISATSGRENTRLNLQFHLRSDPNLCVWKIEPLEKYRIENIEYYVGPDDMITEAPNFIATASVNNNTSIEQGMTMHFTEKASEQSKFSETEGVSISTTIGSSFGIPNIFGGNIQQNSVSSSSWSFEEGQTKEDTRSYDFPVRVPAGKSVTAEAIVTMYNADISYKATFRGMSSGRTVILTGAWKGVRASTINYTLTEYPSGRLLKTIKDIPQNIVDLTK